RLVTLPCQVRDGNGPWRPCSVLDLSEEGIRLSWVPQFGVGRRIWVRIEGLEPMPAIIRWKDNKGIGCELSRQLSQYVVYHLARLRLIRFYASRALVSAKGGKRTRAGLQRA